MSKHASQQKIQCGFCLLKVGVPSKKIGPLFGYCGDWMGLHIKKKKRNEPGWKIPKKPKPAWHHLIRKLKQKKARKVTLSQQPKKQCMLCGAEFNLAYSQQGEKYGKFCSRDCYKQWRQLPENRVDQIENRRRQRRKKRRENPQFRCAESMRRRVAKICNGVRLGGAKGLLGCGLDEFRQHMESKFQPGMSWDNYGVHGWHVDHIIPCSSFDLTNPEQVRICFHYTNLQPLWAADNMRKSNKVEIDTQAQLPLPT